MRSKLIAYFIILTAHHVVTRYEVIAGKQRVWKCKKRKKEKKVVFIDLQK